MEVELHPPSVLCALMASFSIPSLGMLGNITWSTMKMEAQWTSLMPLRYQNFFSAEMKLCNIHMKNLIILSVSRIFKGFKNWKKVAEICYQLVHDRASRGLALFLI